MGSARPNFVFRASNAFSSFAVTVAMAVLTILALVLGVVQDTKAESSSGSGLLGITKVEDPALEWAKAAVNTLPERAATAEKPRLISRKPLSPKPLALSQRLQGPTQEWMGISKLAFPLLVDDLAGGRDMPVPAVMTGQTVGTAR